MNFFDRWMGGRGARADAEHDLSSVDERLMAELGPKPKFDPLGNPEHAEHAKALANRAEVEELREDIVRSEDKATDHIAPWLTTLGLLFTVIFEVIGAHLVIGSVSASAAEGLPLSVALALSMLAVTALTAHRTAPVQASKEQGAGVLHAAKRSVVTLIILGLYTAVVIAISTVRVINALAEDATAIEALGRAAIVTMLTAAPPWCAEWLVRKRAPAAAARKHLRALKRRLTAALRARTRAQTYVNKIAREATRWDTETARRRALYITHHRIESAKVRELKQVNTEAGSPADSTIAVEPSAKTPTKATP